MRSLGLDIGSNSVGSAWVDTDTSQIVAGVSVFPAGVEDSDKGRGAPKNQKRREKRSQRRQIRRKSDRKKALRCYLIEKCFLPSDDAALQGVMALNPWQLRAESLERALSPHEFGRILVHLNQRRGAAGLRPSDANENGLDGSKKGKNDKDDEGKVKQGVEALRGIMRTGDTVGQTMARLYDERTDAIRGKNASFCRAAIRNRRDSYEFCTERDMIRDEFSRIWHYQSNQKSPLAAMLTETVRLALDDPTQTEVWRSGGKIFGQRRTYWDAGTLGRCNLEPTAHCCPKADMYAQEFLVLETINNIRVRERDGDWQMLSDDDRPKVIKRLEEVKDAKPTTIRTALGLNKKAVKDFFELNIEKDDQRALNTNWFLRAIARPVFGDTWELQEPAMMDSINRAVLKFDPTESRHEQKLRAGIQTWWSLDSEQAERFIQGWKTRPKIDDRLKLSRKAILNLLPYMREGASVNEARNGFAKSLESAATPEQRARYAFSVDGDLLDVLREFASEEEVEQLLRVRRANKATRQFIRKHKNLLPPPPMLSNPVVRKAIYAVREHINLYVERYGVPDRVVIELATEMRENEQKCNARLDLNRKRNGIRRSIEAEHKLGNLKKSQLKKAVDRVLLCRQQNHTCPYTGTGHTIDERDAACGNGVELDHIVPRSWGAPDGLVNMVLCIKGSNQNKRNRTPRQWLSDEQFDQMKQRMRHLNEKKSGKDSYFTGKDNLAKWNLLQRDMKPKTDEEWQKSQLTDTAYAAREVADYLQQALYPDAPLDKRKIFFTRGGMTGMLRHDWGLFHTPEALKGLDDDLPQSKKDRRDHRHHAVDAVAIALTGPRIVQQLVESWKWLEEQEARTGQEPRRQPIPVPEPWESVDDFRAQVIGAIFGDEDHPELIVSHRPVKRKIVGPLHQDTDHGIVDHDAKRYTKRTAVDTITPKVLRLPREIVEADGTIRLEEPKPEKSGFIRDLDSRRVIREQLRERGLDPDRFTDKELKKALESGPLRMRSGVPIRKVTLLKVIKDPVIIERDGSDDRVYIGGNNHHMEIIADRKSGKWYGKRITMFDAVRRVRPPTGIPPLPAVQRDHGPDCEFIMSLAEGEMIRAIRKGQEEREEQYFRVAKIDDSNLYLVPHWDARRATGDDARDMWKVSPSVLVEIGRRNGFMPRKVRVNALGEIRETPHD